MCRNGPVSSSSTGVTPKTSVYHASLVARSVTVTATCVMAGIVAALATVVSCSVTAAGRRGSPLPADADHQLVPRSAGLLGVSHSLHLNGHAHGRGCPGVFAGA